MADCSMTYRVWLLRTYGNMGSAILVKARRESEARVKANQLGYCATRIANIECLGK